MPGYFDTNGDNFLSPTDAVVVINAINSPTGGGGEGESLLDGARVAQPVAAGPLENLSAVSEPSEQSDSGEEDVAPDLHDGFNDSVSLRPVSGESQSGASESSLDSSAKDTPTAAENTQANSTRASVYNSGLDSTDESEDTKDFGELVDQVLTTEEDWLV
jgi:hypothetical protein